MNKEASWSDTGKLIYIIIIIIYHDQFSFFIHLAFIFGTQPIDGLFPASSVLNHPLQLSRIPTLCLVSGCFWVVLYPFCLVGSMSVRVLLLLLCVMWFMKVCSLVMMLHGFDVGVEDLNFYHEGDFF